MASKQYEKTAEDLVTPIAESFGLSIYDVEYVKEGKEFYLRVYIDKPGGVTIDDCEKVSRAFSAKLDETDPIPDAYVMEVSSPGLGRALKKDRHFEKSIGEEVEVGLYKPDNGQKSFTGILKSYDAESFTIELSTKEEKRFIRKETSSVRLTVDF